MTWRSFVVDALTFAGSSVESTSSLRLRLICDPITGPGNSPADHPRMKKKRMAQHLSLDKSDDLSFLLLFSLQPVSLVLFLLTFALALSFVEGPISPHFVSDN